MDSGDPRSHLESALQHHHLIRNSFSSQMFLPFERAFREKSPVVGLSGKSPVVAILHHANQSSVAVCPGHAGWAGLKALI